MSDASAPAATFDATTPASPVEPSPRTPATRVLVRATVVDDALVAFGRQLAEASGCAVAFVVDERRGASPDRGVPVVGITDARCAALGLFCPPDYAWRCGDYALYLGADRYPDDDLFWMIEYDVRFAGSDRLADFFAFFADRPSIDLLATDFRTADWDWHWALNARASNVRPYRCLFPVVRLSRRAISTLLETRIAHGRRWSRRALWPNDEAFVATTLANGPFVCRDFNSFGRTLYSTETFSFDRPIDGDAFDPLAGPFSMLHPVLYGERYAVKSRSVARMGEPMPLWTGVCRRTLAKLNSRTAW